MDWSTYSLEALYKWAETCILRADVDLEGLTQDKKNLLYFVAGQIENEIERREILDLS